MRIIKDNFTPELCILILFDNSAIPVTVFGLTGKIDPFLIAGFSQAVSSFINYISTYLPDLSMENAVINNFINSGFYYRKFTWEKNNKEYAFIFRPIYNKLFSKDWVSKILNAIVKELEKADDIAKKSLELFQSFNSTLFDEIKSIDYIREYEEKTYPNSNYKLLFRESGVKTGSLDDPNLEEIIDLIVNNFNLVSECKLNFDGHVYDVKKETINGNFVYYRITTFTETWSD
ncbi:MAG: hypothetical protein ACTSWR_01385 [Candidatus Helarchaeota archaeon]